MKNKSHHINNEDISLEIIHNILQNNKSISLSEESKKSIDKCRTFLEKKLQSSINPIYGINTGFGSLCNIEIPKEELEKLQENLVTSHACGTGELVPTEVVELMLLFKIQSLSYGYSGVRSELVEQLIFLFNQKIFPIVYQQGSLGASGDLAPLAHLSLPLIAQGEVLYNGEVREAKEVLEELDKPPLVLQSKEGLALLNGTQFMSAYAVHCLIDCWHLLQASVAIAALSLEAFHSRSDAFFPHSHAIRKQKGQSIIAQAILKKIQDSPQLAQATKAVQDPYSFRCIPQVLGAVYDTFSYVSSVVEQEINSVTDNPNIFPNDDLILSAGNFHGEPIAMALDFLAIALNELASISERRTYLLVSGQRDLPPYLIKKPGIQSGFMIPQYTAASIVSQNKQLATPCSIDSIPSSNGQEDHVSMGANAATRIYRMVQNTRTVLAIELLTAAQAIQFREWRNISFTNNKLLSSFRAKVSAMEEDRIISIDIAKAEQFIQQYFEYSRDFS